MCPWLVNTLINRGIKGILSGQRLRQWDMEKQEKNANSSISLDEQAKELQDVSKNEGVCKNKKGYVYAKVWYLKEKVADCMISLNGVRLNRVETF